MKRFGQLFDKVISVENLQIADYLASRGKAKQPGVIKHLKDQDANILRLHEILKNGDYKTSGYKQFTIHEPKERIISRLPYYPDRIVHHAIMNVLEPILVPVFTADTYSCIKGRGVHSAAAKLEEVLRGVADTTYCLKIDIEKFYPSIDHNILKDLLRRKIKDNQLLALIDEIIDSAEGLPIGNYLSQYLANLYLSGFDHWLKETMRIEHYFRYCDDMVILYHSKVYLHQLLSDIRWYLTQNLNLKVKSNYQIFPVESRGIDFLGYVFRHDYVRLRKSIKKGYARAVLSGKPQATIAAYQGWAKHADTLHLSQKLTDTANEKLQRSRDQGRKQGP